MSIANIDSKTRERWQVPQFKVEFWRGRQFRWCVVIPVVNEDKRIHNVLNRMYALRIYELADILIVDGGSTDGSLLNQTLIDRKVRGLLVKKAAGKLSAQLRCGYAFALDEGYEGIVTIDGNDKDDPETIPQFIDALQHGFDFVQASRFICGGIAENTPKIRDFAIRYIHAPMLRFFSGFQWTDTTQGYRAYSRNMFMDSRISPFRDVFSDYELLAYLSYYVPRLGYSCIELPTARRYPQGKVPTKINFVRGNAALLKTLVYACLGKYNVKEKT